MSHREGDICPHNLKLQKRGSFLGIILHIMDVNNWEFTFAMGKLEAVISFKN